MFKAIIIDHHDSFTWNIKNWLSQSFDVQIIDCAEINAHTNLTADLVVLSPGPKSPNDYPDTLNYLKSLPTHQRVLGICLGMQMMTVVSGGVVKPYSPPLHGKSSALITQNIKMNHLNVARYHSLMCSVSDVYQTIAESEKNIPMIIKHKQKNWLGYQFHPESFLTENSEVYLDFIFESLNITGLKQ